MHEWFLFSPTKQCRIKESMSRIMRKLDFCLCENKGAGQLRSNCEAVSTFVFATRIVQFHVVLNPKFQASSCLLWLHRQICVRPGQKRRRPVFWRHGSYIIILKIKLKKPSEFEVLFFYKSQFKCTIGIKSKVFVGPQEPV